MMGVYPVTRTVDHVKSADGGETWEERVSTPGLVRKRLVIARPWVEERTDCYCCSCPEGGIDAACRNHGWAAQRPCREHGMPGQPWDDSGVMPASVQAERARWAS